jgi:hypothetical protein
LGNYLTIFNYLKVDISRGTRKATSRLDKHYRAALEQKKNLKTKRAVQISIEGRKMSL